MTHYSIVFNTTTGSKRSIQVRNPNPSLPIEEVSAAVVKILENDVFDPEMGSLESFGSIVLTTTERTTII